MTMNIYAQPGTRVLFHNEGGYPFEKEKAAKILTVGEIYTVNRTDVHDSSTDVYLEGFGDIRFNSVQFSDVDEVTNV
jgi:hypothetical protein